jgi:HlyD family secretion protein
VPNEDFKLLPGMTADAHIITAERLDVLRVPLPAIRFTPEGFAHQPGEVGAAGTRRPAAPSPAAESERAPGAERPHGSGGGTGTDSGEHGHGGAGGHAHARAGRAGPPARLWVLRDGKLVPVTVHTGLDDGTLVEVSAEELKEGDVVVVNAVRPGEPRGEGGERPPGGGNAGARPQGGGGFIRQ